MRIPPSAAAVAAALLLGAAALRVPRFPTAEGPVPGELAQAERLLHGLPGEGLSSNMPMQDVAASLLYDHASPGARGLAPALLLGATLLLTFTLGGLIHSPLCGGLGALLAAGALPRGVEYMSVYTLLVLLAANSLAWSARSPGARSSAAAGLALGLTLLQRSVLFLFPPVLAVHGWWAARRERRDAPPLLEPALLCGLPFLLLLPWVRLNWMLEGRFIPFENGRADCNVVTGALGAVSTLEGAIAQVATLGAAGQSPLAWAAGEVLGHPFSYLASCALRLWAVLSLHPVLFSLAALSLALFRRRAAFQKLGLLAGYYVAIHCLMPVKPHYFEALWPLLAALAAAPPAGLLSEGSPWSSAPCSGAAALAAAPCLALGAYTLAIVALYPGRAAEPDRLGSALRESPSLACLRSEQGRRFLAESRIGPALEQLREARRLGPRMDRELDLAWALFLEDGPGGGAVYGLDLAAGEPDSRVRGLLLRMLASLQQGRSPAATPDLDAARRLWGLRYEPALASTARDRDLQSQAMLADSAFARNVAELIRPLPIARQALLLRRFRDRVDQSSPEARSVTRLLTGPGWWLTLGGGDREPPGRRMDALAQALDSRMDDDARRRFCALCLDLPDLYASDRLLAGVQRQLGALARAPGSLDIERQLAAQWRDLATAALKAGKRRSAVTALERAAALNPDADTERWLARLYEQEGLGAKALGLLVPLARKDRRAASWLDVAQASARAGRRKDALDALGRARAAGPGDEDSDRAAVLYMDLGEGRPARELLDALVARQPRGARWLKDRGVLFARLGRRADATRDLEAAVASAPEMADALATLGSLYAEAGRRDDARRMYDRALARIPPEAGGLADLVRAQRDRLGARRLSP